MNYDKLDKDYRDEGWGRITDKALYIRPYQVVSQARQVARHVFESVGDYPGGFKWINKKAWVIDEDFKYQAKVLCSFPKSNGKVLYIVEDNGRIFVHREEQIEYIDIKPSGEPKTGHVNPYQLIGKDYD